MKIKSGFWLLFSAFISVLIFAFFPLIQIAIPTFQDSKGFLHLYTEFLKNTYNLHVIGRTFKIALLTMIIVLILGIPISLWIARQKSKVRSILTIIILFPMLTNAVVRNFAWIIILGRNGILNNFLMSIYVINSPVYLLYTVTAIIIGSAYLFLPIMIISLVGSISELNIEAEEAAAVLGANPWVNLIKIVIPQLVSGILTGCILVFAGAMTAYTTPQILGGNKNLVMSTLIYQQAMTLGNWKNASVIAIVLIIISALSMILMRKASRALDRRPNINA